jgi:hypothetical protein
MKCNTMTAVGVAAGLMATSGAACGQVSTVPTMDTAALAAALNPQGLTITSVVVRNGQPGQLGTYSNFNLPPVSIRDGIVLSSGNVTSLGPLSEAADPEYQAGSPPAEVNNAMSPEPGTGGTLEFNEYGRRSNNIENFTESFDVVAVEVRFTLAAPSQVQFDFIFGSVEFPIWTSSFTDAFLVFLDGTDRRDQITFDAAGNAVQVGSSFAGLETTGDRNTAFAAPHGLIHHLTTTTAQLDAGPHVIIFEVGDVNDKILDSAAFICNLRTGTATPGTVPTDDDRPEDPCSIADIAGGGPDGLSYDAMIDGNDFIAFFNSFAIGDVTVDPRADVAGDNGINTLQPDGVIDGTDFIEFINAFAIGC